MDRVILHCDLNNFFASVECHDHPELAGHAVAVCGKTEERHGIVLAKNEQAKRYGVKTAEPVWQAMQKCPQLVLAEPHFDRYAFFSEQVRSVYRDFTDQIEAFGMDECWLDVTGSLRLFGSGADIARQISDRVKREIGLTLSIGVSFNKIFAKLGSDMKKPDAITEIPRQRYQEMVWPLPAADLLGIGSKTAKRLASMGILTIGDLARTDLKFLSGPLGKMGEELWKNANGLDQSPVAQDSWHRDPKSIGNSITCVRDLQNEQEVSSVLYYLCGKVSRRMRSQGVVGGGLQIFIRDNMLHTLQCQTLMEPPVRLSSSLWRCSMDLFGAHYNWRQPVRALGVRCFSLMNEDCLKQTSLFVNMDDSDRQERLESRVDALHMRFGKNSVQRASLLKDLPVPSEHAAQSSFHFMDSDEGDFLT